jgi:hypothetical protein
LQVVESQRRAIPSFKKELLSALWQILLQIQILIVDVY